MWSWQWIALLIFLKDLDTLSLRLERMLKRPCYTWTGLKLMAMSFGQSSHYLHDRSFHHPQSQLPQLQREMLPKLIIPVQMLRRMDPKGKENLLPIGNLWLHLEGGRRLLEGVDLLDVSWILHHADVQILLVVAEWSLLIVVVRHLQGGDLHHQPEVVLHRHLQGDIGPL